MYLSGDALSICLSPWGSCIGGPHASCSANPWSLEMLFGGRSCPQRLPALECAVVIHVADDEKDNLRTRCWQAESICRGLGSFACCLSLQRVLGGIYCAQQFWRRRTPARLYCRVMALQPISQPDVGNVKSTTIHYTAMKRRTKNSRKQTTSEQVSTRARRVINLIGNWVNPRRASRNLGCFSAPLTFPARPPIPRGGSFHLESICSFLACSRPGRCSWCMSLAREQRVPAFAPLGGLKVCCHPLLLTAPGTRESSDPFDG